MNIEFQCGNLLRVHGWEDYGTVRVFNAAEMLTQWTGAVEFLFSVLYHTQESREEG